MAGVHSLLGYKILLADDFVEGVQEFFVAIISGNCWGGSTVWVQENVKTAQPLTTSAETSGEEVQIFAPQEKKTTSGQLGVTLC